jgi:hypothetical protein
VAAAARGAAPGAYVLSSVKRGLVRGRVGEHPFATGTDLRPVDEAAMAAPETPFKTR